MNFIFARPMLYALWSGLWPRVCKAGLVTRPPGLQSLFRFRHINGESAELRARPRPGREDGDAEPPSRPAEPELNNLKTKSCDVWQLLARALAWSGPICLLGPQCKGYFNLNSNVPTLQRKFEVQKIYKSCFIYTVFCLHCIGLSDLTVTPTNI